MPQYISIEVLMSFLMDELFTFFRYFYQFYIKSNTYSLFSKINIIAEVGLGPLNFSKENQVVLINVKYAWEILESSILLQYLWLLI